MPLLDAYLPEDTVRTFRYEDYFQINGKGSVPQRFILTYKKENGGEVIGWRYTVELSNIQLNINIPEERFIPPERFVLRKKR